MKRRNVVDWRNIGAWAKKILALQVIFSYFLLLCSTSAGAAVIKFEYDQAGNMISGQGKYYEYNDANQLVKVRKDSPSGPVIAEYVYDYQGQRVKKIENGITTYYIGKHYEERKGNTVNEKTNYIFVNGQRVAARIVKDNQPASVSYYLNNHLGSADVVTDAQGNVTERLRYYPYGEYRTQPNPKERHAYTGKERDEATQEYYYEARYYNPSIRRFTQADTVTPKLYDPQSLNRYAYVSNNPMKYTDPTGHWKSGGKSIFSLFSRHWKSSVHFRRTNDWAKESGFSKDDAANIAEGCWSVDNDETYKNDEGRHKDLNTDVNQKDARDSFISTEYKKALDLKAEGKKEESLKALGRAIHSAQDKALRMKGTYVSSEARPFKDSYISTLYSQEYYTKEWTQYLFNQYQKGEGIDISAVSGETYTIILLK